MTRKQEAGIRAGRGGNSQGQARPGIVQGKVPANGNKPKKLPDYERAPRFTGLPSKSALGKGALLAGAFAAAVAAVWWLLDSPEPPAAPWVYAYNAETYINGLGPVVQTHTTGYAHMKLVAENSCNNECFSLHAYFTVEAAAAAFPAPTEEKVSRVFAQHLQGQQPIKIYYYYPMQYQGDLERSEIHSRLTYSALANMGYSSIPNLVDPNRDISPEARAEIEAIWENNPNARLQFCYYHSEMPRSYTDYTVHWYETRPAGAGPEELAEDNLLRNVGYPRVGCERRFPG